MTRIEKTIDVGVGVSTAYGQWTRFDEFPLFMEGVKQIDQFDDTHLHWRAEVAGQDKSWYAEITKQIPDQVIAWRSTSGTANGGQVAFQPLHPSRTRVALKVYCDPAGQMGNVGDPIGAASRRVEGDLNRFKELVENGGVGNGLRQDGATRGPVSADDAATGPLQSSVGPGRRAAADERASGRFDGRASPGSQPLPVGSADDNRDGRPGGNERRQSERRKASGGSPAGRSSVPGGLRHAARSGRWLPGEHTWDDSIGGRPQIEVSQEGSDLVIRVDLSSVRQDVEIG